ncbi:MAG: rhodanese-like domain-containing protein [Alphaproteobacteria bacterium]|nr:rhodanese-like domain-containing protein [Alphaproteobacteria bacterium]
MIRRLIRRALGRPRPAEPSPPSPSPPRPKAPVDEPEPAELPDVEVDDAGLRAWRDADRPLFLLDIRERHEVRLGWLQGAHWIAMNSVPGRLDEIPRDRTVVVYCAAGMRSFSVAHWLREQGWTDAWSLVGGAGAGVEAGVPWDPQGPALDGP